MEDIVKIKGCYHTCPFFSNNQDGMYCGHSYFENKEAYSNFIINHDNSKNGKIPLECPLRNESITIKYELNI
jgi:hypothetical protein